MKVVRNWSTILLFVIAFSGFVSCDDKEVELIEGRYKTVELSCGTDLEIPVLVNNWSIESVKDINSGQYLSDKEGNPLALEGNGKVEASNGWLAFARNSNENFTISLKENFDKSHVRNLLICINDRGQRDYISVVQKTATEYRLVELEYEEIEDERIIYVSDEECTPITLSNFLSTEVWEPTGDIFKNVKEVSIFESDDYGAFDWISESGIDIVVPELIIDNAIRWDKRCTYKEGTTTTPYTQNNKILLKPHTTLYLSGEITYCKRVCNYNFTIRNMDSGSQFTVKGVWTQIVPISTHTMVHSDN